MVSQLPRWVEYGAFVLAAIAGYINVVGLLGFEHQAISHLSGTATLLGAALIESSVANVLHFFAILLSFFLGATLSGVLLHSSTLKLGRHYDKALFIESLMLFCSIYLLTQNQSYGHYMASAACGLQNALATTYSGAVVRTTHVTGIFTDLGIMLGAKLRGEKFEKRKAILFLLIILGFISGGSLGAYLFAKLSFLALIVPATMSSFLAILYNGYKTRMVQ